MPKDCAINLGHLQTVQQSKIGGLITTISYKMRQVGRRCCSRWASMIEQLKGGGNRSKPQLEHKFGFKQVTGRHG